MKKLGQALVMVVVVIAAGVFLRTFVNASLYAPQDSAPVMTQEMSGAADAVATGGSSSPLSAKAKPAKPSIPASYPVKLAIPALGVNATIQETTLNYRGAMGVPTNFRDVAWYARGVVPGDTGTAVIDGHYDNGLGLDGVFKHLQDLHAGDDIYVTTHGGTKLHFRVTRTEEIAYDDPDTLKVFDPQAERAEVKLVTCAGSWVPADRTYNQRVVVTAELVR
jgi:LPXTG-site transpeptidase (sortase) family protein